MTEASLHHMVLLGGLIVAGIVFVTLFFIVAPYGRHREETARFTVHPTLGWILMEAPSALGFIVWFALGDRAHTFTAAGICMLLIWESHYLHRAFVYPFRFPAGAKHIPLAIVAGGVSFNVVNAWLNARWLYTLGPVRTAAWLVDPRFLLGVAMFVLGTAINHRADRILLALRVPGEKGYKIPFGGLYRWVSCPNYMGELIEWCGWALLTWSLPGLWFAIWTAANLVPRAIAHHKWYRAQFPDYPSERRALIPYLL